MSAQFLVLSPLNPLCLTALAPPCSSRQRLRHLLVRRHAGGIDDVRIGAIRRSFQRTAPAEGIVLNEHIAEEGAIVFEHACKLGAEGIISKQIDTPTHLAFTKESQQAGANCIVACGGRLPAATSTTLTGSDPDGWAFTDGYDHTCNSWTSDAMTLPQQNQNIPADRAMLGYSDRSDGQNTSWNTAHLSQGCNKQALTWRARSTECSISRPIPRPQAVTWQILCQSSEAVYATHPNRQSARNSDNGHRARAREAGRGAVIDD